MLRDIYSTGQTLASLDSRLRKPGESFFLLNLHLKSNKRETSHRGSVVEISALSPPRSCRYQLRCVWSIHKGDMAASFMLTRGSSAWGKGEEGLRVFQADTNGNVPPRCSTPLYQSFLPRSGEQGGGREVEEGGGEDRRRRGEGEEEEMSQLCLTALRAELCGLMLPPPLKTHTDRHTQGGGGAVWSGHNVLGNMSASFGTVQPHKTISWCYRETARVPGRCKTISSPHGWRSYFFFLKNMFISHFKGIMKLFWWISSLI